MIENFSLLCSVVLLERLENPTVNFIMSHPGLSTVFIQEVRRARAQLLPPSCSSSLTPRPSVVSCWTLCQAQGTWCQQGSWQCWETAWSQTSGSYTRWACALLCKPASVTMRLLLGGLGKGRSPERTSGPEDIVARSLWQGRPVTCLGSSLLPGQDPVRVWRLKAA